MHLWTLGPEHLQLEREIRTRMRLEEFVLLAMRSCWDPDLKLRCLRLLHHFTLLDQRLALILDEVLKDGGVVLPRSQVTKHK